MLVGLTRILFLLKNEENPRDRSSFYKWTVKI
jgi:hypothetical protein